MNTKTTTDYFNELDAIVLAQHKHTVDAYITKVTELLEQMRLEAFKEGMSEAAEIVTQVIDYCAAPISHEDLNDAHKSILAARDNKKAL